MYLKSLELYGFKSFAKKTTLEFTTPITAVVGPNGSGKSNIAEAFSFVLGEQSIKSMRGKRTEDLIWNGGGDASRANRAGVKVIFDNRKRLLNVDFDEVSIERVIYRDASSEYAINGTQVRLKDIIEILAAAHIGTSGHHIISQGEADKILNANSRERRDMLEDALGLKIYQYKREESERKLAKTEENMKSVESLRKEIAPHLKFLKKQVEKIERTLELKEALRKLAKEYFKREGTYISQHKKLLDEERRKPNEALRRLASELAKAKLTLEKSAGRDAKSDETIKLETDLSAVRAEKDKLVRELGRVEGAMEGEERILRREEENVKREGNQTVPLAEVQSIADVVEEKIKELDGRRDEDSVTAFLAFIRRAFAEFISRHKHSNSPSMRAESESELRRFRTECDDLEKKLRICNERETALHKTHIALQASIEREKDSSREAEREMFRIMTEENKVRAELASLKTREEKLAFVEEDFKRSLHEAGLLLGREVLNFESFVVAGEIGAAISVAEISAEPRPFQDDRRRLIEKMKIRIEEAGASGGEDVLKEYKETAERDAFLERELEDLSRSAASLKNLIAELLEKLDHEFREGVLKINNQFQHFFTLMFGGGSASLQIVQRQRERRSRGTDAEEERGTDAELFAAMQEAEAEEIEEGIEIEVSLPRKKIKGLMMLSGGERALTSIALLFAVSQVNPPPFIVLDETDAALDEANSKKYGDMIENLAKLSQLILITHNRETMSRAGVLYGVTMGAGGVSKLLSIAFDEALSVAK